MEWLSLTGRSDLFRWAHRPSVLHYNFLICDRHFEKTDIRGKHIRNKGKPTLNLPLNSTFSRQELNRVLSEDSQIDKGMKSPRLSEIPTTSTHQAREDESIPTPETDTSADSSADEFEDDTDLHELEESIRKQIIGAQNNLSDASYPEGEADIKTEEQSENLDEDSFLRKVLVGSQSYKNIYDGKMKFVDDIATKSLQNRQTELLNSSSLQPQNTAMIENLQLLTESELILKSENDFEQTDTKSIEYENEQNLELPTDQSLVIKEENVRENNENLQSQTENSWFKPYSATEFKQSELKFLYDLKNILFIYRNVCENDEEFNFIAFNLFISNQTTYKVIRNTFQLPEMKTLRSIKIDVSTRLNVKVLQCLKSKYQKLLDFDKVCVINADIIPLKRSLYYRVDKDKIIGFHEINDISRAKPAVAVLVLMARGISSGWKQILCHCYLEQFEMESVSKWIEEVISEMQEIGFKVVAFTSKYKTFFKDLWAHLCKSCSLPCFVVNGKKILYILDITDLLVTMRDVLIKHNFKLTDSEQNLVLIASWADILNLLRVDFTKKRRIVPKLTKSQVMPAKVEQFKVLNTIQVFSKTVAKALKLYVEVNELNEKCLGTAKLIELVNNLFDALNTSEDTTHDEFKLACQSVQFQLEIIENFLNVFSNITIVDEINNDITASISCFEILNKNVQNISILLNSLVLEYDFKRIYTRNLIQEPLDKFTEKVVKNASKKKGLTAMRFEIAFRKQFLNNLLSNSRCKREVDNIEDLVKNAGALISFNKLNTESNDTDLGLRYIDKHQCKFAREKQFLLVCVFLLEKCREVDRCKKIRQKLSVKEFIDFVKVLDKQIDGAISIIIAAGQMSGVGRHFYESLSKVKFDAPCECFPLDYLKKLFVRFTICDMIKFNNKRYAANDSQREHGFVRKKI